MRKEDRPNLFKTEDSTDLLVENLFLKDAPHWTFETKNVDGLEIRYVEIEARRTDQGSTINRGAMYHMTSASYDICFIRRLLNSRYVPPQDNHNVIDITAFNTDGFDVSGRNVWIHDCTIWNQGSNEIIRLKCISMAWKNIQPFTKVICFLPASKCLPFYNYTTQDDTIAVKSGRGNPASENMLFERINASGTGITIGSIGCDIISNITFRDVYMHHTFKGMFRFCFPKNCHPRIQNCLKQKLGRVRLTQAKNIKKGEINFCTVYTILAKAICIWGHT